MKFRSIVVPALTLAVGLGVGLASTSQAEPVVKTRTVTETVTEEVTPQACLDVIDATEGIADQMVRFTNVSIAWPELTERSLMAGMDMDMGEVRSITSEVEGITAKYDDIADKVGPLVTEFNRAKALCTAS